MLGYRSLDLVGHVWTLAVAARQLDPTRTDMAAYPVGVDLLPILGGWLDIFVGSGLVRLFELSPAFAYNLVLVGYFGVAGLGGWALARALGASEGAALLAGLLLQLDGFPLWHATGGRVEQVGLGFVALALALVLRLRRGGGPGLSVATGLAGTLVVFVSWEHGFTLALGMLWLCPFLLSGLRSGLPSVGVAPGALRRLGLAALTTLLTAGPWAWLFVRRTAAVRDLHEGQTLVGWAVRESMPLLRWLTIEPVRPSLLVFCSLFLVPWTAPRRDRRLWVGIGGLLIFTLLLSLGPRPALWEEDDLGGQIPGLWSVFQALPVLGWFHTPARLLYGWDLAAVVAAALLVDRLAAALRDRPQLGVGARRALVGALVAALLGGAGLHVWRGQLWLEPGWMVRGAAPLVELGREPGAGAVLDLPPVPAGVSAMSYTADQLVHGRPIPYHMTLAHLTTEPMSGLYGELALIRWSWTLRDGADLSLAPATFAPDLARLYADGFRFIVLHPAEVEEASRREVTRLFLDRLGVPEGNVPRRWIGWRIPAPSAPAILPASNPPSAAQPPLPSADERVPDPPLE